MNDKIEINSKTTAEQYFELIATYGVAQVWEVVLTYLNSSDYFFNGRKSIFKVDNLGDLYEMGLEKADSLARKKVGQYYTPKDVSNVLSDYLIKLLPAKKTPNLADVACGTGKLMLSLLDKLPNKYRNSLFKKGNIYFYDQDRLVLKIIYEIVKIKYGKTVAENCHYIVGNFLDQDISLPKNCFALSNPPYIPLKQVKDLKKENLSEVAKKSGKTYVAFLEKIFQQSDGAVTVTPNEFLYSQGSYLLLKQMNNYSGKIFSFDNAPNPIFVSRNYNNSYARRFGMRKQNNSIHAAFTIMSKESNKGFRVSPLIRFKSDERKKLLNTDILDSLLPNIYQHVSEKQTRFVQTYAELSYLINIYQSVANQRLKDIVTPNGAFKLDVTTNGRYYLSATSLNLSRRGKRELRFNSEDDMKLAYLFLNSSFNYWWFRSYSDGFGYNQTLMLNLPIIGWDKIPKTKMMKLADRLISEELFFLTTSTNKNKVQENIKFPDSIRQAIDKQILKAFKYDATSDIFEPIYRHGIFAK